MGVELVVVINGAYSDEEQGQAEWLIGVLLANSFSHEEPQYYQLYSCEQPP